MRGRWIATVIGTLLATVAIILVIALWPHEKSSIVSQEIEPGSSPSIAPSERPRHSSKAKPKGVLEPCLNKAGRRSTSPAVIELDFGLVISNQTMTLRQSCSIVLVEGGGLKITGSQVRINGAMEVISMASEASFVIEDSTLKGDTGSSMVVDLKGGDEPLVRIERSELQFGNLISISAIGSGPEEEPGGMILASKTSVITRDSQAQGVAFTSGGRGEFSALRIVVPSGAFQILYARDCVIDGVADACGPASIPGKG